MLSLMFDWDLNTSLCINGRSSRVEVFSKTDFPKNLAKFTGKPLCWSLFFNKVVGLRLATLLKKRLCTGFPSEFCEISQNTFSYRTPPVAASASNSSSLQLY